MTTMIVVIASITTIIDSDNNDIDNHNMRKNNSGTWWLRSESKLCSYDWCESSEVWWIVWIDQKIEKKRKHRNLIDLLWNWNQITNK